MPMSTDINLPRSYVAGWPDRCVCCHASQPNSRTRVWTASIGWWTLAFWNFGALYSVRVPTCRGCGWKLQAKRMLKLAVTVGFAFAGVAASAWLLGSYDGPMRKWLMMIIAIVCLVPFFVWEILFPPVFNLTCFAKTVDYEFRNRAYAAEFAGLNLDQIGGSSLTRARGIDSL